MAYRDEDKDDKGKDELPEAALEEVLDEDEDSEEDEMAVEGIMDDEKAWE
jgi:hypothetical protein